MLCRPRLNSNALNRVAIGYKNPLCLTRAKQVYPALYNGHEIIKDNYTSAIVHNFEDTLEIAEITRKKMNDKMNDPECVTRKVKIAPHDYSKENLLATFTPQKQLTSEQIFWSNDLMKFKFEALKERTKVSRPIKAFTVPFEELSDIGSPRVDDYENLELPEMLEDPYIEIHQSPRGIFINQAKYTQEILKKHGGDKLVSWSSKKQDCTSMSSVEAEYVSLSVCSTQVLWMRTQLIDYDRKHDAIELKNLLIANDNLIAECLSQEVFCVATNSELNVARFTKMHVANTTAETRCLALEAELANLRETNNHDNQKELINHFSKLEVSHLNLQLKYQNLKDRIGNNPPTPAKHTPDFDLVFVIGKMQASLQGKDNVIRQLKKQLSQLQVTRSDTDRTLRVQTTDFYITKLTDHVTHLQAENDLFRAKNDKIKQHYKELKKQVTVAKPSDKSDSTTHRHVVTVKYQKTNVPVPPSTGVNNCPNASGSQPKSHVKENRISPKCMRTRRSYFPPTATIPRHSRKQTTNVVEPEFRTIVEMADNRTMAQMLKAPIKGYEDAIVVPPINANNFELKQTLINLVQSNQFAGRQDPHNHLCFFNKVTSTFRHHEVPNTTIKLLLFPFSLEGEARICLYKETPRSILTWEDLVSKFINQFFPPSKTTYLRNEITNFLQKSNETFNEGWERFKDLLRQCPRHGFSELHQLDTFYNALNSNDQDALDSAA
uniref:Reverse transcriptase domain-containing protein n=1 Tax=Tanacetum cinerariifolium TaxID=118510 RepID=A0A6L2L616_TANCI|nr:reverse transcriptase domain-containing protein [Tanacetum cinerariifolium]